MEGDEGIKKKSKLFFLHSKIAQFSPYTYKERIISDAMGENDNFKSLPRKWLSGQNENMKNLKSNQDLRYTCNWRP